MSFSHFLVDTGVNEMAYLGYLGGGGPKRSHPFVCIATYCSSATGY